MKVTSISYARVFSLPGYENEKLSATAELEQGDQPDEVMIKLREFIDGQHKNFQKERSDKIDRLNKISRLKEMISNLEAGRDINDDVPF